MNTFETANRLQPESLRLSCQNPGEVGTALLMLRDIKVCLLGSTKSVTKRVWEEVCSDLFHFEAEGESF
jgi:hypothetical protein